MPLPPRRTDPGRRRLIALLAAATLGTPLRSRAAGEFDLAALTAVLAQTRSGEAAFTERRSVALLDKTLESSGRLSFEAPDTFVRETLKPRRERVAVVGNTLTLSQGNRSRTLALDAAPEAGLIVEAIRGTLTGNREALEKNFSASVSGSAERWTLELIPREPRLREQVATIRITGERALLREIRLTLPDGDNSVMTIEPIASAAASAAR